jgi:glutamate synthase (NADPH/NADH) small chain
METPRREADYKPVAERITNYREFRLSLSLAEIAEQANRCMTCGIPFCHNAGCPLGNPIPETNQLIAEGRIKEACGLLHIHDNFPEFTGRLCPALCEASCVHVLNEESVTIRQLELETTELGWQNGWIKPQPAAAKTGKRVAVIGSGPAGLAAAQQLVRAGHEVIVYERADLPGGILRYGIPDFKLEKNIIDRRLDQLCAEGIRFECGVSVGIDIAPQYLRRLFDAVILTGGAMEPRDLAVPNRDAAGIHFAMDYLIAANKSIKSAGQPPVISASGKKVIILGGGDTGADCLGTAIRQGAVSVKQFEIMPKPPENNGGTASPARAVWPRWAQILRTGTSHKEGGERRWSVSTKRFLQQKGVLTGLECAEVDWQGGKPVEKSGSGFTEEADLVLLALGFIHPKHDELLNQFGVELDGRGNVKVDPQTMMTSQPGIFAAGDMQSGASLVVRCIQGGRLAAYNADKFLTGYSDLLAVPPL